MITTYIAKGEENIQVLVHGNVPKGSKVLRLPKEHEVATKRSWAYFQRCWRYNYDASGNPVGIYVDMDLAREYHMAVLRETRNFVIKAYDLNTTKALERNDKDRLQYIQAVKQQLRDLPNTLDLSKAETPDELYNVRPHIIFGAPDGEEEVLPSSLQNHPGRNKKNGW
tara:strand:- start:1185 stop:1688 length:504 start_codon:yes stop_codon:yes gene_type:complete